MAETSIGFDITGGIGEIDFATLAPSLGTSLPVVNAAGARAVTAGASPMTVDVAPGPSAAFGVRHTITTIANLTIAAVTLAGATRYDAIVDRYNWSTNSVTPTVVPGTASVGAPKVPPTLNNNPGILVDHLLALVKATNGSTALEISDRRLNATKLLTVPTVDALPDAASTPYGTVAYVVSADATYRLLLVSGSLSWVTNATAMLTEITGSSVMAAATGFTVDGTHVNRCLVGPNWRQIDLELRRSGSEINAANADGNFTDTPLAVLTSTCRPDRPMPARFNYITTDGKEFGGDGRLDPDGTLWLLGGAVARNLASSTAVGTVSVRASIHFGRRSA